MQMTFVITQDAYPITASRNTGTDRATPMLVLRLASLRFGIFSREGATLGWFDGGSPVNCERSGP